MNKFLTTTALVFLGTSAFAEEAAPEAPAAVTLGGSIETVIAEGANDKYGATTSFELNGNLANGLATGSMDFVVGSSDELKLDEWSMGTTVAGMGLSFGDQGNAWISTEAGSTIEEPTMNESLQISGLGATVALGFTSVSTDVTDISNVQATYGMDLSILEISTAGDYNIDSQDWVIAGRADTAGMIDGVRLGGAMSYGSASENIGFEADATVMGVTAYLSGDQDDMAQHVGGSYTYNLKGLDLEGAVDYDINAEAYTPKATLSFNF
jgi:hypothetical protein